MNDLALIGHNSRSLPERADRIRSLADVARGCIIEIGAEPHMPVERPCFASN